jgi:hypothetical protein
VGGVLVRGPRRAFGPLTALIPVAFLATLRRRPRYALLSGVSVATTSFFAASYVNADIGRYYLLPALLAWSWLAILAGVAATAIAGSRSASLRPRAVVAIARAALLLVPTAAGLGDRARRVDRSGDDLARRWLDRALEVMEPDALIVSWWSFSTPLWYAQHVEGQRPDVATIDDRTRVDLDLGEIYDVIDANLPTRPVYVIRADLREIAGLAERYTLEYLDGPDARALTKVIARRGSGG